MVIVVNIHVHVHVQFVVKKVCVNLLTTSCYCTGPYLIVATSKSLVGSIDGHAVYSITDFDVIPFSKSTIHLSDVQVCYMYMQIRQTCTIVCMEMCIP